MRALAAALQPSAASRGLSLAPMPVTLTPPLDPPPGAPAPECTFGCTTNNNKLSPEPLSPSTGLLTPRRGRAPHNDSISAGIIIMLLVFLVVVFVLVAIIYSVSRALSRSPAVRREPAHPVRSAPGVVSAQIDQLPRTTVTKAHLAATRKNSCTIVQVASSRDSKLTQTGSYEVDLVNYGSGGKVEQPRGRQNDVIGSWRQNMKHTVIPGSGAGRGNGYVGETPPRSPSLKQVAKQVGALAGYPGLIKEGGEERRPSWVDETCSICLTEWVEGDVVIRMPCGHHLHRKCAIRWAQAQQSEGKLCPLCMQPMFGV